MSYTPGKHVLLDLWGADGLTDVLCIETAMRDAAKICGATILDIKLHSFGEGQGVTGVAILAESHMSIHTWPENSYAALDIFMCGNCDPMKAVPVFENYFNPDKVKIREYMRGE